MREEEGIGKMCENKLMYVQAWWPMYNVSCMDKGCDG